VQAQGFSGVMKSFLSLQLQQYLTLLPWAHQLNVSKIKHHICEYEMQDTDYSKTDKA
jgi:hypothetical protein